MKKHTYIYEKVLTFALAFAMIVGFWSGMTLDARAEGTMIKSIVITMPEPVAGERLPDITQVTQSISGTKVTNLEWYEGTDVTVDTGIKVTGSSAKANTQYTVVIECVAADGYFFSLNDRPDVELNNKGGYLEWGTYECKITYEFPATGSETTHTINSVEITIDPPVAGKTLAATCNVLTEGVVVKKVEWRAGIEVVTGQVAHEGTVYQLRVYLEPEANYEFGSVQTIVNGNTTRSFLYDSKCVYLLFTATGPEPSGGDYKIIEGNNSNYVPGSDKPLRFRGDGEFNDFLRVEVDGKIVEEKYYTKEAGSTIITFTPEYLATLSEGSHTVKMVWGVNGEEKPAECSFYIGENGGEAVPGNTGTTQPANGSESKPRHTCNFEWVITVDPTTGADGLEEYKCTGCGAVSQSHPIPASVAVIKDFYGKVKEAPEKGSITYDAGKLYTISDYILKKMAERNDVSVTVKFEYKNRKYQLIFPAGLDYSAVLTDKEIMYGYFGAAAKLGLKVVE